MGRELDLENIVVSVENANQELIFRKSCSKYGIDVPCVKKEKRCTYPRYEVFFVSSFGIFTHPVAGCDLLKGVQADAILSVKSFVAELGKGDD